MSVEQIKELLLTGGYMIDIRPIVAVTMRACGCTYQEIGEAFGMSKQGVEAMVKKATK